MQPRVFLTLWYQKLPAEGAITYQNHNNNYSNRTVYTVYYMCTRVLTEVSEPIRLYDVKLSFNLSSVQMTGQPQLEILHFIFISLNLKYHKHTNTNTGSKEYKVQNPLVSN